jgi:NAD(P)-dependent dehydrogenase (short-subunit alcohol dehydrogenase family)
MAARLSEGADHVKLGLEGQVVLMTGATSGMGPEIATAFAEEGPSWAC